MLRLISLLLFSIPASAQGVRFEWKAGEEHKFVVKHDTTITETLPGKAASVTVTKLTLSKTWSVTAVDADGSATMSLAITALRQEIARPGEETVVLDSATPDGAQHTASYLGKPILTAKIDPRGRVSDVKSTVGDAAARLQAELPFRVELPTELKDDTKWERVFTIKLDPPVGTGETHEASQTFAVEKREGARTTIKLSTSLKSPPKEVADLQPLLPWLWEGTVTLEGTRYAGANLSVSREYGNHQGVGSKFVFASTFVETRVEK